MDRTVGSFKSFIQTVPPNPNTWSDISPLSPSDQTLPPLFVPPNPKPKDSAVHVTSWRAPTDWNLSSPSQPSPKNPVSTARTFSPLIPEPSPSTCSSRAESGSWPLETRTFQSPRLQPIHPILECRPEPPPLSTTSPPVQTPSLEGDSKILLSPIRDNQLVCSSTNTEAAHPVSHSPLKPGLQTCENPSADTIYQLSDVSRRAKAYVSLGIMLPSDTRTGWQYWSSTPHVDNIAEISRSLQGKTIPPLYRTSPFMDDECEDEELSDRMQLLSFSQDYHDVLADQYHECRAPRPRSSSLSATSSGFFTCGCISIPIFRLRTHELLPEPLAWGKGSGWRSKHKQSNRWTSLRQSDREGRRRSVDENLPPRATEGSTYRRRKRIPDIISHAKVLRGSKRRAGSMELSERRDLSQTSRRLASGSSSQGNGSLLIRLPRGFALVRLSRATTSHSEATYDYGTTTHEDHRQKSSAVSDYPWRRSSFYNSSPPSSPFPYDIPPPLPVNLVNMSESRLIRSASQASEMWTEEKCNSILPDEETVSRGLMDRARDMRDAWRRHQREVRHEKIKQSIKVLGLVEPASVAGYTKSWGMRLGDVPGDEDRSTSYKA